MDWTTLFIGLCKLGIVTIFVNAAIEVLKGISAVGLLRMVKELVLTLVLGKDPKTKIPYKVSAESWKTLSFVLALTLLKVFNFTLLAGLLGVDLEKASKNAPMFDYIFSASVIYMGSQWFFKQFGFLVTGAKEVEGLLTKTVNKSSSVTEEKSTVTEQGAKP
jgi:hypothetical protein